MVIRNLTHKYEQQPSGNSYTTSYNYLLRFFLFFFARPLRWLLHHIPNKMRSFGKYSHSLSLRLYVGTDQRYQGVLLPAVKKTPSHHHRHRSFFIDYTPTFISRSLSNTSSSLLVNSQLGCHLPCRQRVLHEQSWYIHLEYTQYI